MARFKQKGFSMKATKSNGPSVANFGIGIARVSVQRLWRAYLTEMDDSKRLRAYYVYHCAAWGCL